MVHIKKFIILFVLAFAATFAHAASCTLPATCVQFASTTGLGGGGIGSSATTAIAFGSNNTAGNTLIAVIGLDSDSSPSVATVADTQGNVWVTAGCEIIHSGPYTTGCIAYARDCNAGANTVTVTQVGASGNMYQVITVTEYAGLLVTYPYDQSSLQSSLTSPAPAASITTAGTSELVISYGFSDYNNTGTWGTTSGWNLVNTIAGSTYFQMAMWEQSGVAPGTWSNTVTNTGTNRSLNAGVAAFRTSLPSGIAHLQDGASSYPGVSGTFAYNVTAPFSITAGNGVIVMARTDNGNNNSATIAGCGDTWYKATSNYYASTANTEIDIFYAQNAVAGACSPVVTWSNLSSFPQNVTMFISEYSGLSHTFMAENVSIASPPATTPVASTLVTAGANDLLYSIADCYIGQNGSPPLVAAPTAGFTQEVQYYGARPIDFLFDQVVAPGTWTNSVGIANCNADQFNQSVMVAFRSVIPAVGSLQYAQIGNASTGVSTTITNTLPQPVLAGDMVLATVYVNLDAQTLDSYLPTITDNHGTIFQEIPNSYIQYQTGSATTFYAPNNPGGTETVTVNLPSAPGGTVLDLDLTEVHGVAATNPLYSSAMGTNWTTSSTNSTVSSSIVLPTGATYYLYSPLGDLVTPTPLSDVYTITPGSFAKHNGLFQQNQGSPFTGYLRMTTDEVVPSGTYNITYTSSGTITRGWGSIAAFSTVPFTGSRETQSMVAGNAGPGPISISKTFVLPITAGNRLAIFGNFNLIGCSATGGVPSIADTLGSVFNLIKGGTASDYYAVWVSNPTTSGTDVVTMSCTDAGTQTMSMLEITATNGVAQANGNNNVGTTVSDGGITTIYSNELVEAFAGTGGPCDSAYPQQSGNVTLYRNFTNSTCSFSEAYDFFAPSPAAYSNTYTPLPSVSQPMSAAIIGFIPLSSASPVQPTVQVTAWSILSSSTLPIAYDWGVVGDTSASWTAPNSWDAQSVLPVDIAITGSTAYTANAYSEGGKNSSTFSLSTPQKPTAVMSPGYLDEDQFVTTDGINVYYAQVGSGWPASVPYVMAWNILANNYYTFPSGTVPTDGSPVPSSVDYGNLAGGVAVQISGNTLAISHTAANQILLFNKTSGALLSTLSVPSPGRMAYNSAGVLWYISGVTVTNGTITLPGLVAPLTVAIDPTTSNVLVADGGSSQQVKTFSSSGTLLSTYGVLGGYTDCSPTVSKTRLWLDDTAGRGYAKQTLLAVLADSSYWVGDPGNARILHISSAGSYIEEISFMRYLYYVAIDHVNPSRVFADALEFSVNYSIPLVPGDGSGGAWALVRNWAACVPSSYTGQFGFRFAQVQTLPNGLTYAMTYNPAGPYNELTQLPASGPLVFSGQFLTTTPYIFQFFDHSGNLAYWNFTTISSVAVQAAYSSPLTGYSGGWPTYGAAAVVATVPNTGATTTPNGYQGWGQWFPPISTTNNYYPTYQTAVSTPGSDKHLGAVLAGGTNWSWTAAPGALLTLPDGLGTFNDNPPYGGHGGIAAASEGKYILQGYDGQWAQYASQWFLYSETGTFIGQFGHGFTLPAPSDGSEYPAASGNIWTMGTAQTGSDIILINSDEGYHPGINVTHIKNLP